MARCQVCDGPVVNGRCKLCGMPYRNDEVLYHLNESRGEHYKHATAKARVQMRENQVPIADRKKQETKSAAAGKEASKPKGTAKDVQDKRNHEKRQAAQLQKKQKSSKKSFRLIVVCMIFILAAAVISETKDRYEKKAAEIHWGNANEAEEYLLLGIMDLEQPEMLVGDTYDDGMVMPGEYMLDTSKGYMEVVVQYAESGKKDETYVFFHKEEQIIVELHKGDKLFISGCGDENNYLRLYLIEQYDESAEM